MESREPAVNEASEDEGRLGGACARLWSMGVVGAGEEADVMRGLRGGEARRRKRRRSNKKTRRGQGDS